MLLLLKYLKFLTKGFSLKDGFRLLRKGSMSVQLTGTILKACGDDKVLGLVLEFWFQWSCMVWNANRLSHTISQPVKAHQNFNPRLKSSQLACSSIDQTCVRLQSKWRLDKVMISWHLSPTRSFKVEASVKRALHC